MLLALRCDLPALKEAKKEVNVTSICDAKNFEHTLQVGMQKRLM
jgi:hypothetical protein